MGFFSWKKSDDGEPVRNKYTEMNSQILKLTTIKGTFK